MSTTTSLTAYNTLFGRLNLLFLAIAVDENLAALLCEVRTFSTRTGAASRGALRPLHRSRTEVCRGTHSRGGMRTSSYKIAVLLAALISLSLRINQCRGDIYDVASFNDSHAS